MSKDLELCKSEERFQANLPDCGAQALTERAMELWPPYYLGVGHRG